MLRRARDERAKRLAIAERHRDQALGADQREKAVARVGALETDIADLDERLAQLAAREDDTYRRWHEDAHHRRFQRPEIERLLTAEWSAAARSVSDGCRAATCCRPPTRWARRARSLVPGL